MIQLLKFSLKEFLCMRMSSINITKTLCHVGHRLTNLDNRLSELVVIPGWDQITTKTSAPGFLRGRGRGQASTN